MSPSPAETISVRDTLDLLESTFPTFAEGVANGCYAFWLGSGISLGVVPGLWGVVETVIEFLRANMNQADATCKFNHALVEALQLAGLNVCQVAALDLSIPFDTWPKPTSEPIISASPSFGRFSRPKPSYSLFVSGLSSSTSWCGTSSRSPRLTPLSGFSPMLRIYASLRSVSKASLPTWCQ